ncbi:MAG: hypothetical protein Q9219_001526 [cf. Caloplaca sp. 3 TL-2023]
MDNQAGTNPSCIAPQLPFPPLTRSHILHCSYHSWHPRYRSITPKARLIPLTSPFLAYLREDGILLPPENVPSSSSFPPNEQDLSSIETDSGIFSAPSSPTSSNDDDDDEEVPDDPSLLWPTVHSTVKTTIASLGGNVVPKLNWSAPKDATWINAGNSMECRSANDVYLLLKSSDFITHDLEHAFDGCVEEEEEEEEEEPPPPPPPTQNGASDEKQEKKEEEETIIPYHLILRKTIPSLLPSLEFRCFVRARTLLCISQRDPNYYDFLHALIPVLRPLVQDFFDENLKASFEDENFVFDVYVPGPPFRRVWLMDVNPWAGRTDPLLFSWLEVLGMEGPAWGDGGAGGGDGGDSSGSDGEEEDIFTPEFRLVHRNDPEAYSFNTPQYSAHKMPKDVVDASGDGEAGLREFMGRWREIVREQENTS